MAFSNESISPDPDKVATLKETGASQPAAEVPSLLSSAGANANFIEGLAQVSAPLRELLGDNVNFQWTTES